MSLLNHLEIEEKTSKTDPNTSDFIFHHLPSSMGITLGNYFRRILLVHVSGAAPFGVEIADKNGPKKLSFTTLVGVSETTPYLIMNLKKIVLEEKKLKEGFFYLDLNVENKEKSERPITANDFTKSQDIEIKNPELYLATLAPGGSLKLKLHCQRNWGYHLAKEQKKAYFSEEDNVIPLDTDYSPIKIVNIQVNPVVVSLEKQEEQLNLTITTNGVIKPKKALEEALTMSQNLFNSIGNLINEKKEKIVKENK